MRDTEFDAREIGRLMTAALVLALLCLTAVLMALRADAREVATSAPIPDDPVVAPDPHESADNDVTFPADI